MSEAVNHYDCEKKISEYEMSLFQLKRLATECSSCNFIEDKTIVNFK